MKGVFITGTDTGVGKTFVSQGIIAGWRASGLSVGVMKPSETGFDMDGPRDFDLLLEASGADLEMETVCPYRYGPPLAPSEAADLAGEEISFKRIGALYRTIAEAHDVTLVEGAGGLLVPFAGERTAADLAAYLALPLIIVARIGLGTINHTWLTVEAARARGLKVLGVIFSRTEDPAVSPPGPDEARNPAAIERLADVQVLANIPFSLKAPGIDVSF
jgi:dethiobiotin synthetase